MMQRHLVDQRQAQIVCVWCGGVVSTNAVKDASRMCQDCFYRMFGDYISTCQRATVQQRNASER